MSEVTIDFHLTLFRMCYNFEETINSLHEEERFDIYITGSNAFLLSSDLATLFRGRVFQIDVYPFSCDEYLQYYPSDNVDDSFDKYVSEQNLQSKVMCFYCLYFDFLNCNL